MNLPSIRSTSLSLIVLLLSILGQQAVGASEQRTEAPLAGQLIPNSYLVLLKDDAARWEHETDSSLPSIDTVARQLADLYGAEVTDTWNAAVLGFHIKASALTAERLASDPLVRLVEQDRYQLNLRTLPPACYVYNSLLSDEGGIALRTHINQSITCDDPDPRNATRNCVDNWGLDRIDQTSGVFNGVYTYDSVNRGTGVHVYLMDTGIRQGHQEFKNTSGVSRIGAFYNALSSTPTAMGSFPDDCAGHGTHVAAIVGGLTSGVAKDVTLHPVKVANPCSGESSANSTRIVNALNWIVSHHNQTGQPPSVVNWSGGNGVSSSTGYSNYTTVQNAAQGVLNAGITFVQSAGNQKDAFGNACTRSLGGKSGLSNVIVVGGTDWNDGSSPVDGRWIRETGDPSYTTLCTSLDDCGSNSGSCVDLWAPAAHIISAYYTSDSGYCRLSGTSMAAPHVAGAAALYLKWFPSASPAAVESYLVDTATCGKLDTNPSSPYYIGSGSPDLIVNARFSGGGPTACSGSSPFVHRPAVPTTPHPEQPSAPEQAGTPHGVQ